MSTPVQDEPDGTLCALARPGRPTRAVIDLDALSGNVRAFRRLIGAGVELMAVVKANAYGHGAVMAGRTALAAGASQLAVATDDEAAVLRAGGITAPVLVLGPIGESEVEFALRLDCALTVGDERFVRLISQVATGLNLARTVSLHLKVDTGMRRFGTEPERVGALAGLIQETPGLALVGIFSHFADADAADTIFTDTQGTAFDNCLAELDPGWERPRYVHLANTAATLRGSRYHRALVRVGIGLYGLAPSVNVGLPDDVRSVMRVVSRVARVFSLAPGDSVSYGRTYRATRPERVALVPIGYADGYRRGLSDRASMGIGGHPVPIRGRVCMDQTVVGLPEDLPVEAGAVVTVLGTTESGAPNADNLAELLGTISYEFVSGIAARVPRVFVQDRTVVAVEDLRGLRPIEMATAG